MQDFIVLKIGGSVITEKAQNKLEARTGIIRQIAKEIKMAKADKDIRLVVVHGAGSFGHKPASDFGISDGLKSGKHIEGFVRTHNSVAGLDKIVVDCFMDEGLLAFPIQTSACIIQKNKKIFSFNLDVIKGLLDLSNDVIPVLYGDVVVDAGIKGSIISGDAIVPYLAKNLGASSVLLGSDVDGIFTSDPKKDPSAKLIEEVNPKNLDSVIANVSGAATVDVTGGMRGKILEIKDALSGIPTVIFNLNVKDNLYKLLVGGRTRSTLINL